jgi:hypothetical protein
MHKQFCDSLSGFVPSAASRYLFVAYAWEHRIIGNVIMSQKHERQRATEFHLTALACIQVTRNLPAESVDLVVTSPPYNIGVRYSSYDDPKSRDEYVRWTLAWATAPE